MMNAKEFATVRTETKNRNNFMYSARAWKGNDRKYTDDKTCKKFMKDSVKSARKANRKLVAAKAAGSKRPVSLVLAAVLPLMENMAERAADTTLDYIAKVRADVAANGLDVAFPEPVRLTKEERWNRVKVAAYDGKVAAHNWAARVCGLYPNVNAEEFAASEVESAVYHARAQFLAFAFKLESKVGEVTEATLQPISGVWGESYLNVTTAAGEKQLWKTQTIMNRSCLGKLFFQWPTRKVKA